MNMHQAPWGKLKRNSLTLAIVALSSGVYGAPDGGVVIDGNANIHRYGNMTDINQHSQNTTIVWDSFDIDASEIVNFLQPNDTSIALNRVFSADGTQINGQLNANGRVFVMDANGVLFGQNASVNVGSLVASTLDVSHTDYTHFTFSGNGAPASVLNLGEITAADTGAVALLGGQVSNRGVIQAKLGNVALAAGNQITLDFAGDGLLNVQVDQAALNALAENHGLIQADGGQVLMTAHASDALLQTVVNNTGVIEAQTLQEQDGKILLLGGMTSETGGTVRVGGTLDASAPESGDGGFIETSGSIVKVAANATLDTSSATGSAGTWLLDPTNLEISYSETGGNDGVSHVHTQALQNSLEGGNVILVTADAGGQAGDITIADPIIWTSANTLTLDADGGIAFNDYLHAPAGGLTLNAVGNITTGAEGHINVDTFTLNSGNFSQISATLPTFMADDFVINGGTFTRATGGDGTGSPLQIADVYGLQGLDTTPTLDAVLMNDIDAATTVNWNGGEGFSPIGDDVTNYTGAFDGAGFSVNDLTINRPAEPEVGLFSYLGVAAAVSDLALHNVAITGDNQVGGLAGWNYGSITTSYATGAVDGNVHVGGLVGLNSGSITTSYATGTVDGNVDVGGLVGRNVDSITESYATGRVDGVTNVGGLVGLNFVSVTDSYWDSFTSNQGAAIGQDFNAQVVTEVVGNWAGAVDAYNEITYAGLDFTDDWFIAEGSSRPMLRAFLDGGNISNLYQLQGMAADLGGTYTLLNDIDASATASTDNADVWGGRGFAPVGTWVGDCSLCFTGNLDGQGFVIDGLTIDRPDQNYVGLFGRVQSAASTIENIGLTNVNVEGQGYVGGIAGRAVGNSGNFILSNVFAEGSVTGSADRIGGLVGYLGGASGGNGSIVQSYAAVDVTSAGSRVGGLVGESNGSIQTSYATGSVEGWQFVGGLVGALVNGSITDSYATGAVNATVDQAGGLVGVLSYGSVSRSWASGAVTATSGPTGGLIGQYNGIGSLAGNYWDSETTGQPNAAPGGDLSATEVNGNWATLVPGDSAYSADNYTGFDFTNTWFIAEGSSRPMLRAHLSGGGEIHNLYDLQGMAADLSGSYTLMDDIDASATASTNNADVWGGRGFAPVGWHVDNTDNEHFTGSLDGNGFTISQLTINRADQNYVGLLGYTDGSTLIDVVVTEADVTGNDWTGVLAGLNNGAINGIEVAGQTGGNDYVGGITGWNSAADIQNSGSNVTVTGVGYVGGIAGFNAGTIETSYAAGDLQGETLVGGLVGDNFSSVTNSYASGNVDGVNTAENIGGLVGRNTFGGSVAQSYATGMATGTTNVGGLVGENTALSTIANSFWDSSNAVGAGSNAGTIDANSVGLTTTEFMELASFTGWDIDAEGGTGAVWRIYEGQSTPLLRSFLTEIDVIAYDDYKVYDGAAYDGLHDINATTGAGVRYGTNYAEFVSVFGENGTPYGSDDINSADLEYSGDSQGAVNVGTYDLTPSELW
ncbi:beta strand repeat-containing protein, partial [Gilvimarinus sp. 1_MG-2023]|uniref:beta strand repeat-containing protein n=1 Tax=Gilvimarinus sp. 1_MG-2023 TaxID=3062638 RepID=UPI0026E15B19